MGVEHEGYAIGNPMLPYIVRTSMKGSLFLYIERQGTGTSNNAKLDVCIFGPRRNQGIKYGKTFGQKKRQKNT